MTKMTIYHFIRPFLSLNLVEKEGVLMWTRDWGSSRQRSANQFQWAFKTTLPKNGTWVCVGGGRLLPQTVVGRKLHKCGICGERSDLGHIWLTCAGLCNMMWRGVTANAQAGSSFCASRPLCWSESWTEPLITGTNNPPGNQLFTLWISRAIIWKLYWMLLIHTWLSIINKSLFTLNNFLEHSPCKVHNPARIKLQSTCKEMQHRICLCNV